MPIAVTGGLVQLGTKLAWARAARPRLAAAADFESSVADGPVEAAATAACAACAACSDAAAAAAAAVACSSAQR